jgi:acyl carrier protein
MSTNEIIQEFISHELLHDSRKTPLSDDDQLIEMGIIDSLGIMTLLVFLEERFSIQISGDDLVPENFGSITAISDLIDRTLRK